MRATCVQTYTRPRVEDMYNVCTLRSTPNMLHSARLRSPGHMQHGYRGGRGGAGPRRRREGGLPPRTRTPPPASPSPTHPTHILQSHSPVTYPAPPSVQSHTPLLRSRPTDALQEIVRILLYVHGCPDHFLLLQTSKHVCCYQNFKHVSWYQTSKHVSCYRTSFLRAEENNPTGPNLARERRPRPVRVKRIHLPLARMRRARLRKYGSEWQL
jgi:hypothetical protein